MNINQPICWIYLKNRSCLTYLIFLTGMVHLFSCGKVKDKTSLSIEKVILEIDTVIVDSKGVPLFLNWGLSTASISSNGRFLYNYNVAETTLEQIDLDELSLIQVVALEKEGPDGIGNNGRGGIVHLKENLILMTGFPSPIIISTEGRKSDALQELKPLKALFADSDKTFLHEKVDPENPHMVYGILMKSPNRDLELGTLNLNTGETSILKLPQLEELSSFMMVLDDGNSFEVYEPYLFLLPVNGNILVGSNIMSDLYVYNLAEGTLEFTQMEHRLTNARKIHKLPGEVSDPKIFFFHFKKSQSEISFHLPVYDEINERYIRLSHISHFNEETPNDYPRPQSIDVFINIYDKNFKLIKELPLASTESIPGFYFVKDGLLWIFENIDDEMGFVRIRVN